MRSLFDYKERNVIVSPEALLIPEFEEIYKRDKSKDKAKAIKELSYIYFISDYKSPYISSLSPDALKRTIGKDFMKDEDYEPDSKILAAIDKYKSIQRTPSMLLLNASLQTVHNLTDYLQNIDLQERDKNDKPIYKPSDVTNSLKNIGGIVDSLNKVRANVEKEIQEAATLRGQRKKGNREDPK
jgi:hypothetical protein